jgi:hypothetical protein
LIASAIFAFAAVRGAEAQQLKSTIIEDGTSIEGSSPVKYVVNVIERVIPSGAIVNDFTQYGSESGPRVTQSITYYYAGIDGRTLHIYKVTREGQRESERLPLLLPLGTDDTAVFPIHTFSRRTPFTLRLKKNADNSITVTVVK